MMCLRSQATQSTARTLTQVPPNPLGLAALGDRTPTWQLGRGDACSFSLPQCLPGDFGVQGLRGPGFTLCFHLNQMRGLGKAALMSL